jgi:hypothetical protein
VPACGLPVQVRETGEWGAAKIESRSASHDPAVEVLATDEARRHHPAITVIALRHARHLSCVEEVPEPCRSGDATGLATIANRMNETGILLPTSRDKSVTHLPSCTLKKRCHGGKRPESSISIAGAAGTEIDSSVTASAASRLVRGNLNTFSQDIGYSRERYEAP